jgi:uncharacterized protein YraI
MQLPHLLKSAGLGAVIVGLTAGAAMAAVASASVNVRTGPGTSYGIVDVLRPGESVDITDRDGGWCRVDKAGPNGWVSCNYLVSSRDYDDDYYDDGPDVHVQLGFGTRPVRPHPWWWYGNSGPGFSFGFSN